LREGVGHFDVRVHALFAQDGDFGPGLQNSGGAALAGVEGQVDVQPRVGGLACCGVFGIGTGGVVALLVDAPAHAVPHLVQVSQAGAEHGLGVAPDLQLAFARVHGGRFGPGFADKVAVFAQAMFAQGLHDGVALGGAHLQQHAQLFAEQGFQGQFLAAGADLGGPVFGIARVHAAVADAVAFGHQHVHIQGHAHMPRKGHFGSCRQQAAVAAVVVGQQLALGAQGVNGIDQAHQILRVVQVGHAAAGLAQHLRQDAAAHAVLAFAQVHQHQRGVGGVAVQLGGQGAAHIVQRGKGRHDQADR